MSRLRPRILGVAVVALIGTGCGGEPVTHNTFGRDAARLCAQTNAEAHRLRTSPEPDSDDRSDERGVDVDVDVDVLIIEVYRGTLDDLQGLDAPKPDRPEIERWLAVIDQMLDEAELAHLAHAAGDAGAFDAATERATLLDGRARDLARALDVHEPCRLPTAMRSGEATDLP